MFAAPSPQTRRAQPQTGRLTPLVLPSKGMNARDTFAVMGPEYAISLVNVLVEPYGLRTRKGYTEWATGLPFAAGQIQPVWTLMSYYPATANPTVLLAPAFMTQFTRMLTVAPASTAPPAGKLFASRNGLIYDVTAGGAGPWAAQGGVGGAGMSDFWTWANFQNVAGSFLLLCNDGGGYSYYNGATWTTPTLGTGAGQIANVNPALFCFVSEFKEKLWFIEKDSTRAWYLPTSQIVGAATVFNVGEQFRRGGKLIGVFNWTCDGGAGIDDQLVFISSQGDVVIYKGTDPDTVGEFTLHGVWNVGALPNGRRSVLNAGGDIFILSQFGLTPLSALLASTELGALNEKQTTYLIAPLVARLMRDYSTLPGWQVFQIPKEELVVIMVPPTAQAFGGQMLVYKTTTNAWSVINDVPYVCFVNIDSACFAGTQDGRVVRAFEGTLDNVLIGQTIGRGITCQVTPAYQPLGATGQQKVVSLIRPTFVTTLSPSLAIQIMVDYGPPKPAAHPTLPNLVRSYWNQDRWDVGHWSGVQDPIKEWLGCRGVGFVATAQLEYATGGSTLLAAIDFWSQPGGVM